LGKQLERRIIKSYRGRPRYDADGGRDSTTTAHHGLHLASYLDILWVGESMGNHSALERNQGVTIDERCLDIGR
jgi:cellulase/cellobiase CelA1